MNNKLIYENNQNKDLKPNAVDQAATLFNLQEALINEEYERCQELIQKAEALDVGRQEIGQLIDEAILRI